MFEPEFYDEAVKFVQETGRPSVSAIQRKFRMQYAKAAKIVECMENNGVITKPGMNGARTVAGFQAEGGPVDSLKDLAMQSHRKAEQKWHAYACNCDIGPERERAFQIYENIRVAVCVPVVE